MAALGFAAATIVRFLPQEHRRENAESFVAKFYETVLMDEDA